jgi:hypothetical protein
MFASRRVNEDVDEKSGQNMKSFALSEVGNHAQEIENLIDKNECFFITLTDGTRGSAAVARFLTALDGEVVEVSAFRKLLDAILLRQFISSVGLAREAFYLVKFDRTDNRLQVVFTPPSNRRS